MHTDEIKDAEGNTWGIHHSAYADEGEIIITSGIMDHNISLPVEIFIEFVGRKIMSDHISKLEQMTGKEVLEMLNSA